ncbi:hypothetical protein BUALT_Bualt07G0159100 [Buddleja alternifolia]|uniref:Uncharacterized protein n=1 Tax=Buddleja alternifolia TaxID=168488 RepID=A0AAV6XB89_9LAMI|nr:hypothetical protein BUALT_Bualt07G0159100 [Buddleja alternifolia]
MVHHTCCNKQTVKRGLWSPDEDQKLINYIKTYGHGCWSAVPRLAGLERCGKSCRLRWINYLRPDLKRGSFTPQEALLIIELHKIVGNRWAQIAKHLPGRTDNEVKNFWNSSIKKKLMAHRDQLIAAASAAKSIANSMNPNNNQVPNPQMDHPMIINPNTQMGQGHPTQMDHPMIINPNTQMGHPIAQMDDHPMVIPSPPQPQPPMAILGFDGPIETTYDPQMMSYNPNLPPIPPSVVIPPSDFDDLPSWPSSPYNSPPIDQNHGNFMYGFERPNPMLDNYNLYSNPHEMQAYDHDSAMLVATMPEIGPQTIINGVGFGSPFSSTAQQQAVGPTIGYYPRFGPMHPTHINNIESLMTSFASTALYSTAVSIFASPTTSATAVPPSNGPFVGNPSLAST